jgi:hypothetical protein
MKKRFQLGLLVAGIVLNSLFSLAHIIFTSSSSPNSSANFGSNFNAITSVNSMTTVYQTYVCTYTIDITNGVKRTYRGEANNLSDAQWRTRSACLADFDAGICLNGAYDCSVKDYVFNWFREPLI